MARSRSRKSATTLNTAIRTSQDRLDIRSPPPAPSFEPSTLEDLALWVPSLPPLQHLLDLSLLSGYDVLCELLYPGLIALLKCYLGHLYGRLVVRDHGVYERLVEGILVRECLGVRHPHHLHLLSTHLHRHLRGPELLLLDSLQFFYLYPLGRNDVPRELLYPLMLGVLEGDFGHLNGALVVRDHRVYERLVGIFAVLHHHLAGHAHRAVVHVRVIHPGHPAGFVGFAVLAVAGGAATLLTAAGAPACSEDEGYRHQQCEPPPLRQ